MAEASLVGGSPSGRARGLGYGRMFARSNRSTRLPPSSAIQRPVDVRTAPSQSMSPRSRVARSRPVDASPATRDNAVLPPWSRPTANHGTPSTTARTPPQYEAAFEPPPRGVVATTLLVAGSILTAGRAAEHDSPPGAGEPAQTLSGNDPVTPQPVPGGTGIVAVAPVVGSSRVIVSADRWSPFTPSHSPDQNAPSPRVTDDVVPTRAPAAPVARSIGKTPGVRPEVT